MLERIFLLLDNLLISYYLLFLSKEDNKLDQRLSLIHSKYFRSLRKRTSISDEKKVDKKVLFYIVKQIIRRKSGISLNKNQIFNSFSFSLGYTTELATGEGKTLSLLPYCYLKSMENENLHIITTNDYLSKRDFDLATNILSEIDIKVGLITENTLYANRTFEYKKDIIYTTMSEIGFDHLRLMKFKSYGIFPRRTILFIDEIDSLILDTAQTPMIISDKQPVDTDILIIRYIMDFLNNNESSCIKVRSQETNKENLFLTKDGLDSLFKKLYEKGLSHSFLSTHIKNLRTHSIISKCLEAKFNIKNGIDYFVIDNKITLLDKNTGRPLLDHSFSDKLDIILSIKEGLNIDLNTNNQTHSITIPSILDLYPKVIGTTGSISNYFSEIFDLYHLKVIKSISSKKLRTINTNLTYYFKTTIFNSTLIEYISYFHKKKQPLLINTSNEKNSEIFSELLKSYPHQTINARNLKNESRLINSAGLLSQITISTDITGRGTDIKLGKKKQDYVIKMLGGLSILGTSINKNKRVLQQLMGRTGRQGNPGIVSFMVSIPDLVLNSNNDYLITNLIKDKYQLWHLPMFHVSNTWTSKLVNYSQSLDKRLMLEQGSINRYNRIVSYHLSYLYFLRHILQKLKTAKFASFSLFLLVNHMKNNYSYSYFNKTKDVYPLNSLSLLFNRRYFSKEFRVSIPMDNIYREYLTQIWIYYNINNTNVHKHIHKLACYILYKMMINTITSFNKNNKYQIPYPSLLNNVSNDQYLLYMKYTHLRVKEFWSEFNVKLLHLYFNLITKINNKTGE